MNTPTTALEVIRQWKGAAKTKEAYIPSFRIGEIVALDFGQSTKVPSQVIAVKFVGEKQTYDLDTVVFQDGEWKLTRLYNITENLLSKEDLLEAAEKSSLEELIDKLASRYSFHEFVGAIIAVMQTEKESVTGKDEFLFEYYTKCIATLEQAHKELLSY